MDQGFVLFGIIIIGVVGMIILISKFKWHPFIAMLVAAYFIGMTSGLGVNRTIDVIRAGFGGILGNIGIVIASWTIIGIILEKSGAALTMANFILGIVGNKRAALTMSLSGYITGIPVFCDSGFVVLSPINRALAKKSGVSLAVMATALSSGLYATHCLVPPTPGPIFIAGALEADLGLMILVGLVVTIPIMLAGYFYATKVTSRYQINPGDTADLDDLLQQYGQLPSVLRSFAPILTPIILIALKSVSDFPTRPFGEGFIREFFNFIGNPITALLLGVGLAITLIPKKEKPNTFNWISDGIIHSASILVITGAGGSLGEVLRTLPIADVLRDSLLSYNLGLLIPFIIAVLLKTAMGASTVAMIITATMMAPIMIPLGYTSAIAKVLMGLSIGAGSMVVSHANDSYFWVVSQFSDMDKTTAYKCQTGVTLVQGVVAITTIMILGAIFI